MNIIQGFVFDHILAIRSQKLNAGLAAGVIEWSNLKPNCQHQVIEIQFYFGAARDEMCMINLHED